MAAVAEARLAAVALLLAGLWVEWPRRHPWPEDEVNKRKLTRSCAARRDIAITRVLRLPGALPAGGPSSHR
jgi:hypothetical protein